MVSLWWCRSCSDWFYVKSMRFSQHFECSRNDLIRSCCDRFQKAYHTPLASASCHKTQCNTARSDKRSFLGKTAVPQDAGAQWFEAIPGSSGTDWALAFFSWPGLRWGTLCCYSVWPRTGYQEQRCKLWQKGFAVWSRERWRFPSHGVGVLLYMFSECGGRRYE